MLLFLHQLCVCPLLCFFCCLIFFASFVVCLSSYSQRRQFWLKALVDYCFLVFRHTDEYISLDLFYFVNLTNSCSPIPCTEISLSDSMAWLFSWHSTLRVRIVNYYGI